MARKRYDQDLTFESASDMRAYLASLIERHENAEIADEDFDRCHAALKTMAKVHGDVIREKAIAVAAQAAGVSLSTMPQFFEKRPRALKAAG